MAVEVFCISCKTPKHIAPYRFVLGRVYYCNSACRASWLNRKTEVNCAECGTPKMVAPSRIARGMRHFCNRACETSFRSKQMSGAGHPLWRGGPVEIQCAQCGRPKHVSRASVKRYNFCDRKCLAQWNRGRPRVPTTLDRRVKKVLTNRIKTRIYDAIRTNKAGRSWELLVGYTLEQLKRRLQRTMPIGYTWADLLAGGLHIDHKVPLSVFRFTTAEDVDFKRAWALKNLQLLPASENRRKSAKLERPFQPTLL